MSKIENYRHYDLIGLIYEAPDQRLLVAEGNPLCARFDECFNERDPESHERFGYYTGRRPGDGMLHVSLTDAGRNAYEIHLQNVADKAKTEKLAKDASLRSWISIVISAIALLIAALTFFFK